MAVVKKKKARRSTNEAAAVEADTATATEEAQESDSAPGTAGTSSTRSPKGPALNWDAQRDRMLVQAIASGIHTTRGLAEHLAEDEDFLRGLPASVVVPTKIATRLRNLRADGVNIPSMSRSPAYEPDADHLNSILGS